MYRFAKPLLRAATDVVDDEEDNGTADMAEERRRSTDAAFLANILRGVVEAGARWKVLFDVRPHEDYYFLDRKIRL